MKKIVAATLLLLATFPTNPALANNARGVNTHLCGLSDGFDWSFDKRDQGNFLGVWDGHWGENNELSHTLIVHVAKNGKAKAYYANAAYEPWGVSAGCHLVEGEFSDQTPLVIPLYGSRKVSYYLRGANKMVGKYDTGNDITEGTFNRVRYQTASALARVAEKCVQSAFNAIGFNAGVVDGLIGNKTMRAYSNYQSQFPDAPAYLDLTKQTAGAWCLYLAKIHKLDNQSYDFARAVAQYANIRVQLDVDPKAKFGVRFVHYDKGGNQVAQDVPLSSEQSNGQKRSFVSVPYQQYQDATHVCIDAGDGWVVDINGKQYNSTCPTFDVALHTFAGTPKTFSAHVVEGSLN